MATVEKPKRALVTGASSGMGAGLAIRLAKQGMEVWCAARRAEQLAEVVAKITAAGGKAHALVLDVQKADETVARLSALDAEVGGIDLVVANAGKGGEVGSRPVMETTWENTRDLLQVNLLGAAATLTPFIKPMVARGHGHLAGVSSIAGELPIPRGIGYGASKAGFTFLLEAMDVELRPLGVAVSAILPGFVKTAMSAELTDPMPFVLELEDAVDIIERGLLRRARRIRFPWALSAISRATNALPRALSAPMIRSATRPRKPALPRG
jgi:short-subunit dehydrogenase